MFFPEKKCYLRGMMTPVPPYAITDGTYWPNGKGTIPLPVVYPDNGGTYVIVDISAAFGGDTLDTLVFNGIDLLGGAVAMVAGNDNASALAVLAQVEANTAMLFSGNVVGGRLVINRTDGMGIATGGVQFTDTVPGGTAITAVATRWVLEQNGADAGVYHLLDALDPGVNVADTLTWTTVTSNAWVYLPAFHSVHKLVSWRVDGGPLPLAALGAYWHTRLEPIPATVPGTQYVVQLLPPALAGVNIRNIGGAAGEVDGYNFINGQEFDRSIASRQLLRPITYDSTGTSFAITMNT